MKKMLGIVVCAIVILGAGCARVVVEGSGTPQECIPRETVWQSYYGFAWNEHAIKKAKDGLGLYQVTIHDNYCYSLISVASLGLAVPREIEWQVQRPAPVDEQVELMKPSKAR